jgi:hypothetical protein
MPTLGGVSQGRGPDEIQRGIDLPAAANAALAAQAKECATIASGGLWVGIVFFVLCLLSANIFSSDWLTLIALAASALGLGVFNHYRFRARTLKSSIEEPWQL